MEIHLESEKAPLVLTNVAVGTVWLVSSRTNQGVRAEPSLNPNLDLSRIRLLTMNNARPTVPTPKEQAGWAPCSRGLSELQNASALSLRIAEALADSGGYVGLVQTTAGLLDQSLGPASSSQQCIEAKVLSRAWLRASNDVHKVELARKGTLVAAKRQGIVTNVPPVIPYGPLRIQLREELSAQLRETFLNFRGAVWPQE
jgi:hypothetical protein